MFNLRYTLLLVSGIFLDQITKLFARNFFSFYDPVIIIPKILDLQLVFNKGAAYGIFHNQRLFLLFISLFIIYFFIIFQNYFFYNLLTRFGLIFLLMGALGNFIDRFILGYVIDFINIHIFPVFNLADIFINIGVFMFILDILLGKKAEHVS